MMQNKQYQCQIPTCNKTVPIRSTIKTGEFKGLKVCPICKSKHDKKPPKPHHHRAKVTPKTKEKRRQERKGLPEFYKQAIEELKLRPYCENCGCRINVNLHPVNNIAHALKKSVYKSVMANPLNKLFLCDSKDGEGCNCHRRFDENVMDRPLMAVFPVALMRYRLFKENCVEMGKERLIFESHL